MRGAAEKEEAEIAPYESSSQRPSIKQTQLQQQPTAYNSN